MFKGILAGIGGLILFLALCFGLNLFGLANYSFFAPKYRAVDAQVFKESEQYNDGMIRDLENLKMEYTKANDEQKAALRAIVVHRFSVYDIDLLPNDLQVFYNSINR